MSARADAGAVRNLPGFTTNTLPRNDDGSAPLHAIGFTIDYFGLIFSNLYVNNNGNVTFDAPLATFTPFDLTSTGRQIIAPFFADVDTRGAASTEVTFGNDIVDGRPAFGVDWIDVGYYLGHTDKLNSFQLVLIDRSDVGPGDFDFEFNYDRIVWETGDASSGSGGLGGFSARAGYSNGTRNPGSFFELPGSAVNGALLDTNLMTGLINGSNTGLSGRYLFPVRNGAVAICGNGIVEPGEQCDDGNTVDCDACNTNCTLPACGDGIVCSPEACDPRAPINSCGGGQICSQTCACTCETDAECSDQNPCNGEEHCVNGQCTPGNASGPLPPECGCCQFTGPPSLCNAPARESQCLQQNGTFISGASCNAGTGQCGAQPCTGDLDCDDGNTCTTDTCDLGTGTCVHQRANEGLACNGDAGVCLDGQCVALPTSPSADVDVFTACRPTPPCPGGTVSCDIHVFNHGPSAIPQLTVDMDLTDDLQISGMPMALKVFTGGGAVVGMGPAPSVTGQHLEWTASDVPAGGKAATWFVLQVGTQGGTKMVSARGSIPDPDPSSNTRSALITPDAALCPPADFAQKGVDPVGAICTDDSLFYVVVFQHPGAMTAGLTDVLDPCLDPSTVSALMPEPECTLSGTTISCSSLALDAGGRGQVSFAAKPALGCPAGTAISNQAQVTFDDSFQLATNATSNQLQCEQPQCTQDINCNDGNPCTTDICNLGSHTCVHDRANEGLPCNGDAGVCLDGQCVAVPTTPSADVDVFTACRPTPPCPGGTVSCDIHVFNHGPSAVPQLTVDMDLTNELQISGMPMALKVFTGGGAVVGMGPAPSIMGQHIEWTASDIPAGGKAATWFELQVGMQGGTKTVSAVGSVTDPNIGNNSRTDTITPDAALCPPDDFAQKAVDPSGAVCTSDPLFYVLVFQHPGATTADLSDVLDPCLDPTTVSALMPEPECTISGTAISCSGIALEPDGRGQVSFAAKPRLGCAAGTVISNQAQVTFHIGVDPDFQLSTNPTTNQLVAQCECSQDSDCDDGNACTDDACVNRSCSHTNNSLPCDDGLFCTVGDTCGGGSCTGTPRDCSAAGDQCSDGVCNEATGACQPQPKSDTTTCSDGDACTTGDHCSAGTCVGGPPPNCDDGNVCTADSCDHAIGCVNDKAARNGFACDDGNFCTERDACSDGVCVGVLTGADSDGDGYCDFQETQAGCNPHDPFEIPPQPVRWAGVPGEGNLGANGLLTYAAPGGQKRARISVGSDPSCATSGVCGPVHFCTVGKISDPCTTNADCNQPPNTCRVVVNYGNVPDLTLIEARLIGVRPSTAVPGFTPVTPGCSRKVDVTLGASPKRHPRLRLKATGTVGGRPARDWDRFWYVP